MRGTLLDSEERGVRCLRVIHSTKNDKDKFSVRARTLEMEHENETHVILGKGSGTGGRFVSAQPPSFFVLVFSICPFPTFSEPGTGYVYYQLGTKKNNCLGEYSGPIFIIYGQVYTLNRVSQAAKKTNSSQLEKLF